MSGEVQSSSASKVFYKLPSGLKSSEPVFVDAATVNQIKLYNGSTSNDRKSEILDSTGNKITIVGMPPEELADKLGKVIDLTA